MTSGADRTAGAGGDLALAIDSLDVEFTAGRGTVRAVDGVGLTVRRGETVALVGESGSGKSTLGLAVMGLLGPTSRVQAVGISVGGVDITDADERALRRLRGVHMSMVFQDPLSTLNPVMTIGKQISELFVKHRGMSRRRARAEAIALLQEVRIPDAAARYDQYPQQFSGGMRQRVVIAMALALSPELIVADEPTTALDVTVQARILQLLGELTSARGAGLLLITHDLSVVAGAADRVYVLYGGRVMEQGPVREMYQRPGHPYTIGLLNSVPAPSRLGDRLIPIQGSPPEPGSVVPGCPFAPRCYRVADKCRTERPPLAEISADRASACHFAEEVLRDDADLPRQQAH